MNTILFVDDDIGMRKIFDLKLKQKLDGCQFLFAENGEEAIGQLKRHKINILVTDLVMPGVDGFALLSHVSNNYPSILTIVVTSYTVPGLQAKMADHVFQFLNKPINLDTLAESIKLAEEHQRNRENLAGVSLPGLMQIIEAENKTCLLNVRAGNREQGVIYFHEGEVFNAVCGPLRGEDAAIKLIAMDDILADYRRLPRKKIRRDIHKGTQALILKAMKHKDDGKKTDIKKQQSQYEKKEQLVRGIELCEGMHTKKAQKIFYALIQKKAGNASTWMWMSRTLTNMDQLRVSLSRAYKLDPKNNELKQELRKYNQAVKEKLSKIRRCPFCFAPTGKEVAQCCFCKSHLVVSKNILLKIGQNVVRSELQIALARFDRVLAREVNTRVLFFAGLACLNLKDFDGTLQYHEQLQRCARSEDCPYSTEVGQIVSFIASMRTLHEADHEVSQLGGEDQGQQSLKSTKGQKKVLVVEDSPTTRKVISMTLEPHGYHIIEAADGIEALSKLNDERPNIILLDVMLPKLDGYAVLSLLKQNSELKGIPVVMLTSKDSLKDKLKGRFSSAKAYLTKPFKPEMLISKIQQYIE